MKVDIFNTDRKYDVIYADPPWEYQDKGCSGAANKHYPTLSDQDIHKLPIGKCAKKDCVLFLWATMPKLQEALDTIKAWGFKYKTCAFCWVKQNPKSGGIFAGIGRWVQGNAELCLLATKGHPHRASKSVKQIVLAPRGRHSEKPAEVRKRIETLMGGGGAHRAFCPSVSRRLGRLGQRSLIILKGKETKSCMLHDRI